MPRQRTDCTQAILDSLPSTRLQLIEKLGITEKVAVNNLHRMLIEGLCHRSAMRVARPDAGAKAPRTNVLYLSGKAPETPQKCDKVRELPMHRDLPEPRIDPTINLYRDPLNAMFGM